jgi:hypothetical protein
MELVAKYTLVCLVHHVNEVSYPIWASCIASLAHFVLVGPFCLIKTGLSEYHSNNTNVPKNDNIIRYLLPNQEKDSLGMSSPLYLIAAS